MINLLLTITILTILTAAGYIAYSFVDHDKRPLPPGSLDRKRLLHAWQPLSLQPPEAASLHRFPHGRRKLLELCTPEEVFTADTQAALANAGLPLRRTINPNPPPLPGSGYQVLLLEIPVQKLAKVIEQNGYHDPEDHPDADFRELLQLLLITDAISAWYGLEGIGVHIQLNYEQLVWWYSWLDWDNKRLTTGLGRKDLHQWA